MTSLTSTASCRPTAVPEHSLASDKGLVSFNCERIKGHRAKTVCQVTAQFHTVKINFRREHPNSQGVPLSVIQHELLHFFRMRPGVIGNHFECYLQNQFSPSTPLARTHGCLLLPDVGQHLSEVDRRDVRSARLSRSRRQTPLGRKAR